jgi:YdjC-like protein
MSEDLPEDARAVIVHCDDFGIYPEANSAVVGSIDRGIAGSYSLMVPAPEPQPHCGPEGTAVKLPSDPGRRLQSRIALSGAMVRSGRSRGS